MTDNKISFEDKNLFRGMDEHGEWVFGDLLHCYDAYGNLETFIYQSEKNGGWAKHLIPDSKTIARFTGYTREQRMVWENDRIFMEDMPDCIGQICYEPYRDASDSEVTEHVGFYVDWITLTNGWPEYTRMLRKDLGYWLQNKNIIII